MNNLIGVTSKKAVTTLRFDVPTGWEGKILLRSDAHHDAVHCNRDLEKQHLEKAKKLGAGIIDLGDLFDAMQGRQDPRRSFCELRDEYKGNNYFDLIVEDAHQFYKPYAGNFLLLAMGNHETAVEKNDQTNLTDRLACALRGDGGVCRRGGYGGWVVLKFMQSKAFMGAIRIKYFHGAGGESPVTRGVIQTNRQAVFLPDADIIANGHSHNQYYLAIKRERISSQDVQYYDLQHHIRIPGYKDGYFDGSGGFDVETGKVPKPLGAAWLTIRHIQEHSKHVFPLSVEMDMI